MDIKILGSLSEHFTWEEVVNSETAARLNIDNTQLSQDVITSVRRTATKMEKVRDILGNKPLHINSFYRCLELNTALRSKPTSQHTKGEAVDFIAPEIGTPLQLCRTIIANVDLIRYDQLILEHTWVHISFCAPSITPRLQVISLLANGHYALGLTDISGQAL